MSILDFAELERLNTARTPGPWDAREQRSADPRFFINFEIRGPDPDPSSKYEWPTRVCQSVVGQVREEGDRRDFAFIAAMANTADELLRLTDLSADDIARLPPQTSGWVTQWLYDFRRERFFELYPQPIGTATVDAASGDGAERK